MPLVTLDDVRKNNKVRVFIGKSDDFLEKLGYTEHGFRHSEIVARLARKIMSDLNLPDREGELAAIAGYLHDIGNVSGRNGHDFAGAMVAMEILQDLGMSYEEQADIIGAIGNHDEGEGRVVNRITAALILADKSDVHRSRVRNRDIAAFDIHDRVNYAVEESHIIVDCDEKLITLRLKINNDISHVMEYFEIFLSRMVMCRRAASFLDARFSLVINDAQLL